MSPWCGEVYVTVYRPGSDQSLGGPDEEAVAVALGSVNAASRARGDELEGYFGGHHVGAGNEPAVMITLLRLDAFDSSQASCDALYRELERRWPAAERFAADLRVALGTGFGVDLTSELA